MTTFFRHRFAAILWLGSVTALIFSSTSSAAASFAFAQGLYGSSRMMVVERANLPSMAASRGGGREAGPPSVQPPYRCNEGEDIQQVLKTCRNGDGGPVGQDGGLWEILLGMAVIAIIGSIASRTRYSDSNPANEQALLENGPQLPASYPDGSFSVRGFTRDGWPVVVDFEPQPGTITQLEVTTGEGHYKHSNKIVLDPDGSHGRQLVKVIMPSNGDAPDPTPATYAITSVPITNFETPQPRQDLAPVEIYGIGGGPHAVGSVAIEQLAFNRANPLGATYSYFAKSEFTKARAQVQRFRRSNGTNEVTSVFDDRKFNLSVGNQNGSWPGMRPPGPPSAYRLQVTGWFTTDDRSWVAAVAPALIVE